MDSRFEFAMLLVWLLLLAALPIVVWVAIDQLVQALQTGYVQ